MNGDSERSATRTALAIVPGVLLAGVAGGVAFPILPIAGVRAGLPLPFIGAILAANRATRVVASPLVGAMADRFGGRRMLLAGLAVQVVVMLLYALGITTGHPGPFFLGGRLLHGPGSAGIFVAAQALAIHAGGRAHGGRTAGIVRAAMGIGVPLGLVAGGLFSDRWGDAATFEVAMAAMACAWVVALGLVPDLRVPVRHAASLRDVLRALSDGRLLAVGVLNFAASFAAQGMVLTTLALVVRERHVALLGLGDRGSSGLLMGLMIVVEAAVMPLAGRIGDRAHAHARIALGGMIGLVPALVVVALAGNATHLAFGLACIGLASGALGPSLLALVAEMTPHERRGMAVGVLQLCGDVGGTLGPLVGTALFAGSARTPYLVSAALLASFVPFAVRLARRESAGH